MGVRIARGDRRVPRLVAATTLTLLLAGVGGARAATPALAAGEAHAAAATIAARATAVERDALVVSARTRALAAGRPSPAGLSRLQLAIRRTQAAYWQIAPFVGVNPRLQSLTLGEIPQSAASRPDGPLSALAGSVAFLRRHSSRATLIAAGGEANATLDDAGRLAVALRDGALSSAQLRAGLVAGLGVVAAEARTWAQDPQAGLADGGRADATLAGVQAVLGDVGHDAVDAAGLAQVRRILSRHGGGVTSPALAAPELAWQATALQARVARGDLPASAPALGAQGVADDLFRARVDLAAGDRAAARAAVAVAQRRLRRDLGALAGGPAGRALDAAQAAVRRDDARGLAGARGAAVAAIVTGAYTRTLAATAAGQLPAAEAWAAVRDLGPSAGEPDGADAERALAQLADGRINRARASFQIRRDELDGLQRRTISLVGEAVLDDELHLPAAAAEATALARGYWVVLGAVDRAHAGAAAARHASADFAALATGPGPLLAAGAVLAGFTAAPPTATQRARWERTLVGAVRYTIARDCTLDSNAAPATQLPGTTGGPPVVAALVSDLRPGLDPARAARLLDAERRLSTLPGSVGLSGEELTVSHRVPAASRARCAGAARDLRAVYGSVWRAGGEDGDIARVQNALLAAARDASIGQWAPAAAQARQSYAIFDLTTELQLRAVDPGLATHIESLYWNGPHALLGRLDGGATRHGAVAGTFSALGAALNQAEIVLGSSHSGGVVVANSAIIVLREALEALLVVAALGMGLAAGARRRRRAAALGALAALPATLVTWLLADRAVAELSRYGLRLQAGLDLLALVMVALMLAWFMQKFCWTRFAARHQARSRRLAARLPGSGAAGAALGLAVVGFAVVYREGFETVLFLQAARAQDGIGPVIAGVALGLGICAVIGVVMLGLRRRLPYRRMIVVSAGLVGIVALAMAGQTVRAMQAAGWVPVTPVAIGLPEWAGLWLGLYPAVQTLSAQLLAAAAIAAGWPLAERLRARRLARRIARAPGRTGAARTARGSGAGESLADAQQVVRAGATED